MKKSGCRAKHVGEEVVGYPSNDARSPKKSDVNMCGCVDLLSSLECTLSTGRGNRDKIRSDLKQIEIIQQCPILGGAKNGHHCGWFGNHVWTTPWLTVRFGLVARGIFLPAL